MPNIIAPFYQLTQRGALDGAPGGVVLQTYSVSTVLGSVSVTEDAARVVSFQGISLTEETG